MRKIPSGPKHGATHEKVIKQDAHEWTAPTEVREGRVARTASITRKTGADHRIPGSRHWTVGKNVFISEKQTVNAPPED